MTNTLDYRSIKKINDSIQGDTMAKFKVGGTYKDGHGNEWKIVYQDNSEGRLYVLLGVCGTYVRSVT